MAEQANFTLNAELDALDFSAGSLSSEYRLPIQIMINRLRSYEVQCRINCNGINTNLLRCSRICSVCPMSDLKYQKGEWYHVQEDGTLEPVDYEEEVKEYYKNRIDRYGKGA